MKKNPWEEISLEVYEKHMSLDSVKQLQAMNKMMKGQLNDYPVRTAMILGIAGGNGLEHVQTEKYDTVYGVDINEEYLNAVKERYGDLKGVLECIHLDLINEMEKLPPAELVIANLLVEYIGYPVFRQVLRQVDPEYVSCGIQINRDETEWVSDSPYLHAFDRLDEVHHQMDAEELTSVMKEAGYDKVLQSAEDLPNGKSIIRLDYKKTPCVGGC